MLLEKAIILKPMGERKNSQFLLHLIVSWHIHFESIFRQMKMKFSSGTLTTFRLFLIICCFTEFGCLLLQNLHSYRHLLFLDLPMLLKAKGLCFMKSYGIQQLNLSKHEISI